MRSDVHSAALRAAAKVAFSVAFIGGCSAPTSSEVSETDPTNGDTGEASEPGTSESNYSAPKKKQGTKAGHLTTGCHEDPAPKQSCEQVVNAAFPTDGNYPGVKQTVSTAVQACCVELLDKSQGSLASHRWDCCANLPANVDQKISIACTPWGPPVPPSMKRRAKQPDPEPTPWLALAEVA